MLCLPWGNGILSTGCYRAAFSTARASRAEAGATASTAGWTCFFQACTFGVAGRNAAWLAGPDDVGRSPQAAGPLRFSRAWARGQSV